MTSSSSPCFSISRINSTATTSFLLRKPLHLLHSRQSLTPWLRKTAVPPLPKLNSHFKASASLSSFAHDSEAGAEAQTAEIHSEELPEMARAFHISSKTASAISVCIALAALSFPLAMSSLGQCVSMKMKVLSYITLLSGFYMAWNIGANDVANAMGTSVGSGALTLRQAVVTAAVLEFSGALLMGTHVTSTMQKGILVASVFQGKDSMLFAGLLSSLAAAGTWLQV